MKTYSRKSEWWEWTTDSKADRKTTKAHKSSERWRAKREIGKKATEAGLDETSIEMYLRRPVKR